MTDGDVLRNAIIANPDDDIARLAYADWLDEQGDEKSTRHAAFIRSQITLARTPHDHKSRHVAWINDPGAETGCVRCKLEKQDAKDRLWAADNLIPAWLIGRCTFRRGFVSEVACSAWTWVKYNWIQEADTARERLPIRKLVLCSGSNPQDCSIIELTQSIWGMEWVGFQGAVFGVNSLHSLLQEAATKTKWISQLNEYDFLSWIGRDKQSRQLWQVFQTEARV